MKSHWWQWGFCVTNGKESHQHMNHSSKRLIKIQPRQTQRNNAAELIALTKNITKKRKSAAPYMQQTGALRPAGEGNSKLGKNEDKSTTTPLMRLGDLLQQHTLNTSSCKQQPIKKHRGKANVKKKKMEKKKKKKRYTDKIHTVRKTKFSHRSHSTNLRNAS